MVTVWVPSSRAGLGLQPCLSARPGPEQLSVYMVDKMWDLAGCGSKVSAQGGDRYLICRGYLEPYLIRPELTVSR